MVTNPFACATGLKLADFHGSAKLVHASGTTNHLTNTPLWNPILNQPITQMRKHSMGYSAIPLIIIRRPLAL